MELSLAQRCLQSVSPDFCDHAADLVQTLGDVLTVKLASVEEKAELKGAFFGLTQGL